MSLIDKEQFINEMNTRAEEEALDFRDIRDMVEFAPTVNAIPIPEGATNGDMIEIMFPDRSTFNGGIGAYFDKDWWNAPYKKESEGNND